MHYKIKEVADMSGVSIRMLRHYDKKGLLTPNKREDNGYRLYSEEDLSRLRHILFFRELNFSIEDTTSLLSGSGEEVKKALIAQKQLLELKIERLNAIKLSVEAEIENNKGAIKIMGKDKFKEFDMTEIEKHKKEFKEETKKRYGKTSAFKQSEKRTNSYSKKDWARIQEEADSIYTKLFRLIDISPDNVEVLKVVSQWRQHINDNYYDCTDEIFSGLADMYVQDSRFTENIDKHGDGLAEFMSKAMKESLK